MTLKILLVEDNPDTLYLMHRVLSQHGCQVINARCGEEALAVLNLETIDLDLILSDVMMPGLSGTTLKAIVSQRHPPIPILLMSAAENSFSAAGTRVIDKMIGPNGICHEVLTFLSRNH